MIIHMSPISRKLIHVMSCNNNHEKNIQDICFYGSIMYIHVCTVPLQMLFNNNKGINTCLFTDVALMCVCDGELRIELGLRYHATDIVPAARAVC